MHPRLPLSKSGLKHAKRGNALYPWLSPQDLAPTSETADLPPGGLVTLTDPRGAALATGTYNPASHLAFRLLDTRPDAPIDVAFFAQRLQQAAARRERYFQKCAETSENLPPPLRGRAGMGGEAAPAARYHRLVHSEGDHLPGLVIDRFGDIFVLQVTTAGMELLTPALLEALHALFAPRSLLLRNDSPTRLKEGLPLETRLLGAPLPPFVEILENGLAYFADLLHGQKTGWFYDQRENRAHLAALAPGKTFLDVFCHSGGIGLLAASAGASHVTFVDSAAPALALARRAAEHNGLAERCTFVEAKAFDFLTSAMDSSPPGGSLSFTPARYDIVSLDPPAFVKSRKDIAAGLGGYQKLARLAAPLVAPGGIFFIASCSHHAAPVAFRKAVEAGLREGGRSFSLLRSAGAAPDHPAHPLLPQNSYLKALTYRLDP